MNITVASPDEIIASFPHSTLPKIASETHYESLVAMRDMMKENYMSITSRRGGGMYGYLRGLFLDAVYGNIAPGTAFVTPPDPEPLVIQTGSTNINLEYLNQNHTEACREHKKWVNLERARGEIHIIGY